MTNKERVNKFLKSKGYVIGCWDDKMEQMSLYSLSKMLKLVYDDSTDIIISINRKVHVVEVCFMDKEVDFSVFTKSEYIDRYGDEKFTDEY